VRFRDRADAGRKLALALAAYRAQVVLALPRGGVPVAAEIAAGVPFQPELATGAVVEGDPPLVVRNEGVIRLADIDEADFDAVYQRELEEIARRRERYLGDRQRAVIVGRTAIVVDDGIATGATTRAALRATRMRGPKQLILAVPVAPSESVAALRGEVDQIVCLEDYSDFGAIGYYYTDFRQVSDEDVIEILRRCPALEPSAAHQPA
jgi:putative phosphoribosyl transferase